MAGKFNVRDASIKKFEERNKKVEHDLNWLVENGNLTEKEAIALLDNNTLPQLEEILDKIYAQGDLGADRIREEEKI